jgi:hypothetical protein
MAIEIITEVPRPARLPVMGRAVTSFLGLLLVIAGLGAAVPVVMVVFLFIVFAGEADAGNIDQDALTQLLVLTLVAGSCLTVGLRLRRGKRRLVLFLRRFGFEGSSRAVTFAVGTALGRRWRLVTLDDAKLAPVGVSTVARRAWGLGRWITLVLTVAGLIYAAAWIRGDEPAAMLSGLFENIYESGRARGDNPFSAMLAAVIVGLLIGVVLLMLSVAAIVFPIAVVGATTLFTWGTWRAINTAERSKAAEVRTEAQLEATFYRVAKRMRRIFAPRLVVLLVAHEIWQEAVRRLAATVSAILIDVSEPTENLLWEIRALEVELRSRWVLVGRRDRVETLIQRSEERGAGNEIVSELRDLLEGERILVYEGDDKAAMKRFAAALHSRLEERADSADRTRRLLAER